MRICDVQWAIMDGTYGVDCPTAVFLNPEDWNHVRGLIRAKGEIPLSSNLDAGPEVGGAMYTIMNFLIEGVPVIYNPKVREGIILVTNKNLPYDRRFNFATTGMK